MHLGFFFKLLFLTVVAPLLSSSLNAETHSAPDAALLRAVADDIDSLLMDTLDEGSFNVDVSRDTGGNPVEASCLPIASATNLYRCSLTFSITPYEGEDLGEAPWGGYCEELIYQARLNVNGRWTVKRASEDGITNCLESLSEGP